LGGGGIEKYLGSVNMRKAQIYIKKQVKTEKMTLSWRVSSLNWGSLPPWGVSKNITERTQQED